MRGKSTLLVLLAVVALLAIGTWAPAQGTMQSSDPNTATSPDMKRSDTASEPSMSTQAGTFEPNVVRAKDLIGMKVVDSSNEDLGKLEEVVLNRDRDKIAFGVMSSGGFLGMGENHYIVAPWSALNVQQQGDNKTLALNKTKDELRQAPHFEKGNWPNLSGREWGDRIRTFFGRETTEEPETAATTEEQPAGTQMGEGRKIAESRRLSELMDIKVKGRNNQDLGKLNDVAVDMREGRLVFGFISLDKEIAGKDMAAIPWSSLNIQPDTMTAQIQADPDTLTAVAFSKGDFPDLSDREYASRVYSTFDREPYWTTYGYVGPGKESGKESGKAAQEMAWGADSSYSKMFDPKAVSTIQGTIVSVGTFKPEADARIQGQMLQVRTQDGQTIKVHLGPRPFLERQNATFKEGEQITITGSRTQFEGDQVVIASQVKAGDKTIQLRNDQGKPMWGIQHMKSERGMEHKGMEHKEKGY